MLQAGGTLLHARLDGTAPHTVPMAAVPSRLAALAPGDMLTLIGLDGGALRGAAETAPDMSRQFLQLELDRADTAPGVIGRILDDLAALALALWPDWHGCAYEPSVLASWRRAAGRLAAAGHRPRFRRTAPRIELQQLLAAVDPAGLVLIAVLDPSRPDACTAQIAALEWCAGAGASIAILCPIRPPAIPPFDRILYGAVEVMRPPEPVLDRLIVPQGKVHGASETEKRVRDAILRDEELAPLFDYNRCVATSAPEFTPRVDLVWVEGVVVELDGREHQGDPRFGDDRHRDYELLVAGYLVLRLTNTQIATDLQRAIEKIRKVVRYRRSQGGLA